MHHSLSFLWGGFLSWDILRRLWDQNLERVFGGFLGSSYRHVFPQLDWLFVPFLGEKLWSITTSNVVSVSVLNKWMCCFWSALEYFLSVLTERGYNLKEETKQCNLLFRSSVSCCPFSFTLWILHTFATLLVSTSSQSCKARESVGKQQWKCVKCGRRWMLRTGLEERWSEIRMSSAQHWELFVLCSFSL